MTLEQLVPATLRTYLFGSVAKGTSGPSSDLDIYVAGDGSDEFELKWTLQKPIVAFRGVARRVHIVGPTIVEEEWFLKIEKSIERLW